MARIGTAGYGTAPKFLTSLRRSNYLMVIEEHVGNGGFGQMLAHQLLLAGDAPRRFVHRTALGYVSGQYGSQRFHRAECGLDPASIVSELNRAVTA
jgi:transketolase